MDTATLSTLLTGLLALSGVIVGVLLEPLKARFGRRAKLRDQQLEQCVKLIDGATFSIPVTTTLNRIYRLESTGKPYDNAQKDEAVKRLIDARQNIRKAVIMLRLLGPRKLSKLADEVREAERVLRRRMYEPDDVMSAGPDGVPAAIIEARAGVEASIMRFAENARKYTR